MTKIVINKCFGGFDVSEEGMLKYGELKGITLYPKMDKYSSLCGPTFWTIPLDQIPDESDGSKYFEAYDKYVITTSELERNDPDLVKMVEELGSKKASGKFASLDVIEIPDDVSWEIDEYDGMETIHETHRSWG